MMNKGKRDHQVFNCVVRCKNNTLARRSVEERYTELVQTSDEQYKFYDTNYEDTLETYDIDLWFSGKRVTIKRY